MSQAGYFPLHRKLKKEQFDLSEPPRREVEDHRFLDRTVLLLAIAIPALTVPQAAQIWLTQSTTGVSLVTWLAYLINTSIWTVYGLVHKDRLVTLTFAFMTVINLIIVLGLIVYT